MTTVDWNSVRFVVFDLDGTLYDQPPLRRAMAVGLGLDCVRRRSLCTIRTLRRFRQVRDRLGERQTDDFIGQQIRLTAQQCRQPESEVRAIVEEWIECRPLALLPRFKTRGIDRLFAALRETGRRIGVWSDYPVTDKLAALGLHADYEAWAGDEGVGRLKPDPAGLRSLLVQAGMTERETLLIGDRFDRDAASAAAIGARCLIRSQRHVPLLPTFRAYDDPIFDDVLAGTAHG